MLLSSAVIATIGPASQSVEVLSKMLEAGMTCARLDLTVGCSAAVPVMWRDNQRLHTSTLEAATLFVNS